MQDIGDKRTHSEQIERKARRCASQGGVGNQRSGAFRMNVFLDRYAERASFVQH